MGKNSTKTDREGIGDGEKIKKIVGKIKNQGWGGVEK